MHDGAVKALWVLGTNPAASMPRTALEIEALARCPFVVVSDCWATDTSALADVILPAAGWGEKDGTVTNSERRISRQRRFRAPPGEARADWRMLCGVAIRMGWGEAFAYRNPADIFREHAALSAFENDGGRLFDIGPLAALGDDEYDRLEPIQWPLGTKRLFGDGNYPTPDGRARCVATHYRPLAQPADRHMPLVLNTSQLLRPVAHDDPHRQCAARLMTHQPKPLLDIHPADAEWLECEAGRARLYQQRPRRGDYSRVRTVGDASAAARCSRQSALDRPVPAPPAQSRPRRQRHDRPDLRPARAQRHAGQRDAGRRAVVWPPLAAAAEFSPSGPLYWARVLLPEDRCSSSPAGSALQGGHSTGSPGSAPCSAPRKSPS